MSQDKGPIYGVELPEELPIKVGNISWAQVVPRRDELEIVRERVGDRTVAALEVALLTGKNLSLSLLSLRYSCSQLLKRSGLDISPCKSCGESVICIPDGIPMCKACAGKKGS